MKGPERWRMIVYCVVHVYYAEGDRLLVGWVSHVPEREEDLNASGSSFSALCLEYDAEDERLLVLRSVALVDDCLQRCALCASLFADDCLQRCALCA